VQQPTVPLSLGKKNTTLYFGRCLCLGTMRAKWVTELYLSPSCIFLPAVLSEEDQAWGWILQEQL
jgi:hypothetical protein